jgi:5-methylthioadenosine/S-adenosylhomocysteine deaminase
VTIVEADLLFDGERWHRDHAFAMQGAVILGAGTTEELGERFPDHEVEDWGAVAVLPGTIDGHAHSFQVLLRGLGDDLTFARWRDRVLYPFSERLGRDAIRAGAMLDFAELLKAGVTTVADFFYLHDGTNENDLVVIEAARELGIRLVHARGMYDWTGAPGRYQESPDLAVRNFRELAEAMREDRLIFPQPAPHSLHGASPDMVRAGADLAEELDLPFHIHVAEYAQERETILQATGQSPVRYLNSLGALTERTILIHCVWTDEADLDLIAERGARIVHNPGANAFLGDGIAPFRQMLERRIPTCLGTDGGCTNSRQSVFEEMRMAALLQKAALADGSAIGALDVLIAGTSRAGEVLGLPIGRIAEDHAADLVVIDLDALSVQPSATAEHQVVYSMQPDAIARVIVRGEVVVERGRLANADEAEIVARVRETTGAWDRPATPVSPPA